MAQVLGPKLYQLTEPLPTAQITTASLTYVMTGFKVYFSPSRTGNLLVTSSLSIYDDTAGDGVNVQLAYGEGTAPNAGDAVTGTPIGYERRIISGGAGIRLEVTLKGIVSGLYLKKKYWFDTQWEVVTGGTGTLYPRGLLLIQELTLDEYH